MTEDAFEAFSAFSGNTLPSRSACLLAGVRLSISLSRRPLHIFGSLQMMRKVAMKMGRPKTTDINWSAVVPLLPRQKRQRKVSRPTMVPQISFMVTGASSSLQPMRDMDAADFADKCDGKFGQKRNYRTHVD